MVMKTIAAAKFKEQCLKLLDEVDQEGIVITKRGKPVAKLVPIETRVSHAHLIGSLKGKIIVDSNDNLFSSGAWVSDEWGDLNEGRGPEEA
jgi:prevent-host-death family protein